MLKITNWNVERALPGSNRSQRIAEKFLENPADLWILTETHRDICPDDAFSSAFSGPHESPAEEGEHMCGIWAPYPLTSLNSYLPDTARCAAARYDHPKYGGILIFACVLPWLNGNWRGIPTKGGAAFSSALQEFREVWKKLKKDFPSDTLIFGGDFNQNLNDRHYYGSANQKAMLEGFLKEEDMIALTGYENDPVSRDSHPHACIDHICIPKDSPFTLVSSERWPNTPKPDKTFSDHFATTVNLQSIK